MPRLLNPAYATVAVGAVSTQITAANTDRVTLSITNESDEEIYLAYNGGTPVVGTGHVLNPGCSIFLDKGNYSEGEVNGICASGGKNVNVATDVPPTTLASSDMFVGTGTATIGAVMIEDKDGSTRLDLKQADAAPATSLQVLPVQQVGESGLSPKVKAADGAIAVDDPIIMVQTIDQAGKVASGGGGGAGGGNMVYLSPQDFTATYAAATQLTLAGLSFVPVEEQFQYVVQVKSDGSRETYQASDFAFNYAGGILTVTGATFVNTDLGYLVVIFGPDKAYSTIQDAQKVIELSPISDHEFYTEVADVTNAANAIYDYYINVATYSSVVITMVLGAGAAGGTTTASLEFSVQDDGTVAASCFYVADVGTYPNIQDAGGGGTTEGFWRFTEKGTKFLHISVNVNGTDGNGDFTILARGQY